MLKFAAKVVLAVTALSFVPSAGEALPAPGPSPSGSPAASVTVIAHAIDGDSLRVGDTEIRLFGVDAPRVQPELRAKWAVLAVWQRGGEPAVQPGLRQGCDVLPTGTDQYGRTLARCAVGNTDLNTLMVALGYAVAYRRYATDYVSAEESARGNRFGLWSGQFELPSECRAVKRQSSGRSRTAGRATPKSDRTARASAGTVQCNIKGNRNRRGEWIYHLPGMHYYEQTRAEDIFCTESEAQAAGYRRAIVRSGTSRVRQL